MKTQFTLTNRAKLWELRGYHGKELVHTFLDQFGRIQIVTGEHADHLLASGKAIYCDVPCDVNGPDGPWKKEI